MAETEKQFQQAVVDLATLCGWKHYHPFDSRRSDPGWPDLVLARCGRLLFRELKTEKGRVTDSQAGWLFVLESAGQDVAVWRPSMWTEIEATLNQASR